MGKQSQDFPGRLKPPGALTQMADYRVFDRIGAQRQCLCRSQLLTRIYLPGYKFAPVGLEVALCQAC